MNNKCKLAMISILCICFANHTYADVMPIQNFYGNVFPTLTDQKLEVARTLDTDGPWYVTFSLLVEADVAVGAIAFKSTNGAACCFTVTSMRLVTLDGGNVAFGTDVATDNPFDFPVDHHLLASKLEAGDYAIEISGSGNRQLLTFGGAREATDFETHLSVTPSIAETDYELGRQEGRMECFDNPESCGISLNNEALLTEDLRLSIPYLNWDTTPNQKAWVDLEVIPNSFVPAADDILLRVTNYGFIE